MPIALPFLWEPFPDLKFFRLCTSNDCGIIFVSMMCTYLTSETWFVNFDEKKQNYWPLSGISYVHLNNVIRKHFKWWTNPCNTRHTNESRYEIRLVRTKVKCITCTTLLPAIEQLISQKKTRNWYLWVRGIISMQEETVIQSALDGTRVFLIKIKQQIFFHVNFLTNESWKAPQKNINIFKVFYSPRTLLWDPRLAILTNPWGKFVTWLQCVGDDRLGYK